jgi:hypothetical protein
LHGYGQQNQIGAHCRYRAKTKRFQGIAMNTALSPLVSEFETAEQEASYTAWLQAKIAASLADPRPAIPHDEVERRMAERLAQLRKRHGQTP